MQWQVVGVHGLAIDGQEFANSLASRFDALERNWRWGKPNDQTGAFCKNVPVSIVDGDPRQPLPIAEAVDDAAQLLAGASFQGRLDNLLQALGKDFGAPLEICAQAALFRANLVARYDESDYRDPRHQKEDQPDA